jgi:hypothetical protein
MKGSALVLLVVIFLLCFCTKKVGSRLAVYPPIEMVEPRPYFPVFPGSYWVYLNHKGDTVRHFTEPGYKKHCYLQPDTFLVPFLNDGASRPIYGYNEISEFRPLNYGISPYRQTPILSETVGFAFLRGGFDSRYGDRRAKLMVVEKKLVGNDSVLILNGIVATNNLKIVQHYTRDVGLTYWCDVDSITQDTINYLKILEYKINR